MLRRNGVPTFEDYQNHKTILIYSHLIIATNMKLLKHQGRPKVKEIFTITNVDHETLVETIK